MRTLQSARARSGLISRRPGRHVQPRPVTTRALLTLALMTWGCAAPDLNQPCMLIKGDGGTVTEREAREAMLTGKVFISFGTPQCGSRVCVRDATAERGATDDTVAMGYCSGQCSGDLECGSKNASHQLSCSLVVTPEVAQLTDQQQRSTPLRLCARADGGA